MSVLQHDFDWSRIGRDMKTNPLECRRMYYETVQSKVIRMNISYLTYF